MIVGAPRIGLGLLQIRVPCFLKLDEKLRSYGPKSKSKRGAHIVIVTAQKL